MFYDVLYDIGAGPSCIRVDRVPKGLELAAPPLRPPLAANKSVCLCEGVVTLSVRVGDRSCTHAFLVVKELSVPVLLGRDILWMKLFLNPRPDCGSACAAECFSVEDVTVVSPVDTSPIVADAPPIVDDDPPIVEDVIGPVISNPNVLEGRAVHSDVCDVADTCDSSAGPMAASEKSQGRRAPLASEDAIVCPVVGAVPDEATVLEHLRAAHGVAHRNPVSMMQWLRRKDVSWRGMLKRCHDYFCEACERVNSQPHGMQPTQIPIGDACNEHYSCDLMYYPIAGKQYPILVLSDNLSTVIHGRVVGVGTVVLPEEARKGYADTPTGARQVYAAMCEMRSVEESAPCSTLYSDNECRFSRTLVRSFEKKLRFKYVPSVPNVHGNGIAERQNRKLRACLDKQDISHPTELNTAVMKCCADLNDSPTDRLRWNAPNDIAPMHAEQQHQLADHIRASKLLKQQNSRHKNKRERLALPLCPTPYLARPVGLHPKYEGPYLGFSCDLHGPNCRRLWNEALGWKHCSPVVLKVYKGPLIPTPPPPSAPAGERCGIIATRCGRSGLKIGRCLFCKECHLLSDAHCSSSQSQWRTLIWMCCC